TAWKLLPPSPKFPDVIVETVEERATIATRRHLFARVTTSRQAKSSSFGTSQRIDSEPSGLRGREAGHCSGGDPLRPTLSSTSSHAYRRPSLGMTRAHLMKLITRWISRSSTLVQ